MPYSIAKPKNQTIEFFEKLRDLKNEELLGFFKEGHPEEHQKLTYGFFLSGEGHSFSSLHMTPRFLSLNLFAMLSDHIKELSNNYKLVLGQASHRGVINPSALEELKKTKAPQEDINPLRMKRIQIFQEMLSTLLHQTQPHETVGQIPGESDRSIMFEIESLSKRIEQGNMGAKPGMKNEEPLGVIHFTTALKLKAYEIAHNASLSTKYDFAFKKAIELHPADLMLERPWLLTNKDLNWLKNNARHSRSQPSFDIPGLSSSYADNRYYQLSSFVYQLESIENNQAIRSSIVKAIPLIRQAAYGSETGPKPFILSTEQEEELLKRLLSSFVKKSLNDGLDLFKTIEESFGPLKNLKDQDLVESCQNMRNHLERRELKKKLTPLDKTMPQNTHKTL